MSPLSLEADDARIHATLKEVKESRGYISNALGSLAYSPEVLIHFARLGEYLRFGSSLADADREAIILASGRHSDYVWTHHAPLALDAGLSQNALSQIRAGEPVDASQELALIVRLVHEALGKERITDSTWDAACSAWRPQQIIDILATATYYNAIAVIGECLRISTEAGDVLETEIQHQKEVYKRRK